jgi:hypothetical protein
MFVAAFCVTKEGAQQATPTFAEVERLLEHHSSAILLAFAAAFPVWVQFALRR